MKLWLWLVRVWIGTDWRGLARQLPAVSPAVLIPILVFGSGLGTLSVPFWHAVAAYTATYLFLFIILVAANRKPRR